MHVDPLTLRPAHATSLVRRRLEAQRELIRAGTRRTSPIFVTPDGVIIDGHHGTRAAAEAGLPVEIEVREMAPGCPLPALAASILDLEIGD